VAKCRRLTVCRRRLRRLCGQDYETLFRSIVHTGLEGGAENAGLENARLENDGLENAGLENAGLNDSKNVRNLRKCT